mgnify:CR=1 FL=1
MDNGAKIRISRETGEIEISGSEQFVNEHMSLVRNILSISPEAAPTKVKAAPSKPAAPAKPAKAAAAPAKPAKPAVAAPVATPTEEAPAAPKRGRGRPKKAAAAAAPVVAKPKGKPGRKPGRPPAAAKAVKAVEAPAKPKGKRGRPKKVAAAAPVAAAPAATSSSSKSPKIPNSFSAYMKSFKHKMKKGDWILAAGYYFLTSTGSESFSTFNTSKLLKPQGVDLANPSQYMKNNISSGRIVSIGKRSYQVTAEGEQYLNMLMNKK